MRAIIKTETYVALLAKHRADLVPCNGCGKGIRPERILCPACTKDSGD